VLIIISELINVGSLIALCVIDMAGSHKGWGVERGVLRHTGDEVWDG